MTDKQILYLNLTDQLSPLWKQDEQMAETDPETWHLVREIDDWLVHYGGWTILLTEKPYDVLYQDHAKVTLEQYRRNCDRLLALYVGQEEGGLVEVGR